ncbi:uncharacterized protein LOC131928064 [Physella acuta]|uniref:uncharacterized protein LOC131928064 n=1 Tax=Physella acuta TaxID=109671 RepID=UPI0027DAD899|nr:uncharacterized protein LOC131928064 [Physella acuta]
MFYLDLTTPSSKSLIWTNAIFQRPASRIDDVGQACIPPPLRVDDPVMMSYVKTLPPIVCEGERDWVFVDNGTLRFTKHAKETYGNFSCKFYNLVRIHEKNVTWGAVYANVQEGYRIPGDFFKVECKSAKGDNSSVEIHAGVAYTHDRASRPEVDLTQGLEGLSIAIIGFDSLSRLSWMRRLPKTREYFLGLGAIELEAYNVVGDGTTAAMFPMLSGKFEWELPKCGLNKKDAIPMDEFPFIWHEMQKAGYLTSWSNGLSGAFNWRFLGFNQQPTDFYTRPYFYAVRPGRTFKRPCIGEKRTSQVWLEFFRDIFLMYPKRRKFLFHFYSEMTHEDNNPITRIDGELKESIEFLYKGGYLENTVLILMGDHGARYGKMRSTLQGKLEEKLPYFSFLFPKWFGTKYPQALKNLRTNVNRLTTPFDIHETFKDFLKFGGTGMGNVSERGISLFKEIPRERTCAHAQITSHWCACLPWKNVSADDADVKEALKCVLETINNYTSAYRSDCEELSLESVTQSLKLENQPSRERPGRTDLTLYQLTLYTTPGQGHFEVTVTYDQALGQMSTGGKEISRINKYGDDSACILKKDTQIKQYCYCRKRKKN